MPEPTYHQALILLHGRGSDGEDMASFAEQTGLVSKETLLLTPTAANNQWYPHRFLVPQTENQPFLAQSLAVVAELVTICQKKHSIPMERIVIGGFSQGACLASQFALLHPQRYAGVVAMSGGAIGSDEEVAALDVHAEFAGTPVYLGCDVEDVHIPFERVEKTAELFSGAQAAVTLKPYHDHGHRVHPEAVAFAKRCLAQV